MKSLQFESFSPFAASSVVYSDEQSPKRPKTLKSDDLFEGEKEICIEHNGALYRLKITRQDKLILNK